MRLTVAVIVRTAEEDQVKGAFLDFSQFSPAEQSLIADRFAAVITSLPSSLDILSYEPVESTLSVRSRQLLSVPLLFSPSPGSFSSFPLRLRVADDDGTIGRTSRCSEETD